MISGRGTSVETLCPDGDWSEDDKQFKLSSEFKDTLRTTFSSTVTEESTEESSED
jgi:hypothetical protein